MSLPFTDAMNRFHHNIDNAVYAAEQECHARSGGECHMLRRIVCPFRIENEKIADACSVPALRSLIGDDFRCLRCGGLTGLLEDSFR